MAFENFEIQLATQKNLVIFMCAFFVLLCGLSIFFLKNEDFLTKQKFNIKCTVKKGQMYEMHCLHNTPLHILFVKSMILKGNQKIVRKPKHSYMLHVKIMGLKWQSNLILYIMLYLYMPYLK